MDDTAPLLEARSITVRFGGVTALQDVDLRVPPAGRVGLVGPNGAGKTTLFGVLSGLLRPDEGDVLLEGRSLLREGPQKRARQGLARTFQRLELFDELTVREHLVLAYRMRHDRPRLFHDLLGMQHVGGGEAGTVDDLLALLGLTDVADLAARSLPLGTGRLLEVARALASSPRIVLLDEPSSGLDPSETEQLAEALDHAQREREFALVLVEHNTDFVFGLCDDVTVLDFGLVISRGTPADVQRDPKVQAAYLGTADVQETA